jgi:Flp pilus assembly pilin Flp
MAKLLLAVRQYKFDKRSWPEKHVLLGRVWLDNRGQDMIEYALLAASIAVVVAGFLPPAIMPAISTIFSKIVSGFDAS